MTRKEFLEMVKKTNEVQNIVIEVDPTTITDEQWDVVNESVADTYIAIRDNKDDFIKEFSVEWFDYIVEDLNVGLWDFGVEYYKE